MPLFASPDRVVYIRSTHQVYTVDSPQLLRQHVLDFLLRNRVTY